MPHTVIEGFRLSPQQARAWRLHQPAPALYAQTVVAIEGPLDSAALDRAVDGVVLRHEIFRTCFQALPEMELPVQVIAESAPPLLLQVDARGLPAQETAALVSRVAARDRATPWNLSAGPLLRCVLLAHGGDHHTLIITLPPVAADHATLTNIVREIAVGYGAGHATGAPGPLDSEPLQYVEFAEWQRELAESESDPDALRFWQQQETPPTERAAFARLCRETTAGPFTPDVVGRDVEWQKVRRVGVLTNTHRLSDAAFWIGCWYTVLRRITGRADFVIGRVFHGRRYPETQEGMGPVARCVPLRCQGDGSMPFTTLGARLHQAILDADARQEQYEGEAQARPLVFEIHQWPAVRRAGDLRFRTERQVCQLEPFLLKLTCWCGERNLRLELHFDRSAIAPATAEWMFDHLLKVADGVLADATTRVDDLDVLTSAQRQQLVAGFNDTACVLPDAERSLAWHVAAQAARTPGAIAVAAADGSLTYDDLDGWAGQIARQLRARGVGPEARVAVLMRRSPRMLAAMLGVLKAGAAYVPLDPGDPSSRTTSILEDAAVEVVLTDGAPDGGTSRHMDVPDFVATSTDDRDALPQAGPDQLAYVIYTSGSTGRPKGTLVTQRGLMNYLLWAVQAYGFAAGGSAPLHSSVAFDLSVTSLFAPLLVGGVVVVSPDTAGADALARVLRRDGAAFSVVKTTPAHLQALAYQLPVSTLAARTQALIVGGEALYAESLRPLRDAAPDVRIYNEYGPTETVVGSCVFEVTPATPQSGVLPIGRPVANTQVYVVDRQRRLLPPGAEGELLIGGTGVARGYLNRPELTAERFIPDPFGPDGARVYRTGDIVRQRTDGTLVFVGRADGQVKIRGHRVELGEIEAALRELPGVQDVAVLAREDAPGDRRLVAYIAADRSARPPADALRVALGHRLPPYMHPAAVVWLDALPLTRNGKVDRRALSAPGRMPDRAQPLVRPTTPVEDVLATIWADVLGLDEVSVHDNFFALGGDSIRAIQVCARAAERGLPLTHELLFEAQTIAAIGERVTFGDAAPAPPSPLAPFALVSDDDRQKLPDGLDDAYPISALQGGMIFHSELTPESAIFHDLHSFVMRAPLEMPVMQRALAELMERHAALRTAFELSRCSRPLQLVYRDVAPPLEETDLRHCTPDEQRVTVEAWLEAERRRPFEWRRPPLLRFHVHRLSDEHFQFTLSFHHAILDGWSAASLFTELFNRCRTLLEQPESPAPPGLRCAFRDFIALENEVEASDEARLFWRERLDAAPAVMLPRREPQGADAAAPEGVEILPVDITDEVIDGLRRLTRRAALPLKSVALAAHAKVLAVETNQRAVVTGLVSHGRPAMEDGDRVLGLFLNTVPCVVHVGSGSWLELAQAAFDAERRLWPFRRYPLARLQRERGGPVFDVGFNFMHYHVYQGVQQSDAARVEGYTGYEETDLPLTANFYLEPDTGRLRLTLNYRRGEFAPEQVACIAERYRRVLAEMAADPDRHHARVGFLAAREPQQVVGAWARGAEHVDDATTAPVTAWLEETAARVPDAPALEYGDETITYAHLHARANQLARHLRALGVERESLVAICLERSPELVIAVLATLKAGGAYVPLDPSNPAARLSLVLADARPRVLVTREALAADLPLPGAVQVRIDADWPAIAEQPTSPLAPVADARDLAYVIYTSGSTGIPKGVMVTHAGLRNYLRWCCGTYGATAADGAPLHSSAAFDLSITSLFVPLVTGAPVTLVPESPFGTELARVMRQGRRFSFVKLTPAHLQALALQAAPADVASSTAALIVGGEALHAESLRPFRDAAPGLRIFNEYGPTETVVGSTVFDATATATAAPSGSIPIGSPIVNTQVYVLDRDGHPVPPRVSGELYIGGAGVARGYFDRPALTAERFLPDPFTAAPGARLYRTGDIARWRADGVLEYVGRADQQVKIRGYRVELGEIEAVLQQHEGVRAAVAVLREDVPGDRRLVGYLVPSGDAPSAEALQQVLRERLPEYLVPRTLVWLDELPLTANGKVDRRRLPAPTGDRPALAESYVAPRTAVEEQLVGIWAEVLRVERIGVDDNFFALGGHSLTAMQVIARVRDAFSVDVPLRPLFESPTIAQIARLIEEARSAPSDMSAEQMPIVVDEAADVDRLLDELEVLEAGEVQALLDQD